MIICFIESFVSYLIFAIALIQKFIFSQTLFMCSTHNPKKHYFSTREKVCVRFTFVNEDSMCRSFMIDVAQFQQNGALSIVKAILYIQTKGFNVEKYRILLPQFDNTEVDFQRNTLLPFQKLPKKELYLHLQKKVMEQVNEQEAKKTKEPERYIGEVIEKVKIWRQLFNLKKVSSLKQAAMVVNVPKKSLDDYFLLLRQGQILEFDFENKLNCKMGQLRAFIKGNSKRLPVGKLPEELSKLKCYSLVSDYEETSTNSQKTTHSRSTFEFEEMKQNLKLHPMDLDDDCDYVCNNDDSD